MRLTTGAIMSVRKTLDEKVTEAEQRLAQLRAQANLKKKREKAAKAKAQRRERLAQAYALTRQQDAHRKIELGGVVIAAGADHLDPAELCGLLLVSLRQLTPEKAAQLREMGLTHFEARKASRADK